MGISLPGRDRRQARPPGSEGRRAVRRRRLPDEQPGARDREADRGGICVVIWRDDGYGLIDWKQRNEFGRPFGVEFGNPDFVDYARVLRDPGFRPESADDLYPTLMRALERRRAVARRRADRLRRERAADRAAGGAGGRGVRSGPKVTTRHTNGTNERGRPALPAKTARSGGGACSFIRNVCLRVTTPAVVSLHTHADPTNEHSPSAHRARNLQRGRIARARSPETRVPQAQAEGPNWPEIRHSDP